jgi:two-component system, chemotaxis family, chemotaxis protein CheY
MIGISYAIVAKGAILSTRYHTEQAMRILIVEDEYISRVLLSEMLSAYGTCHTAINGEEAVEILKRSFETDERFDLVCLDIMMPELDGQEVLRRIREMEKERHIHGMDATKVIMTTALDDSKNIMQAFAKGHCEAYLTKPLDRGKLLQHLRDLRLIH